MIVPAEHDHPNSSISGKLLPAEQTDRNYWTSVKLISGFCRNEWKCFAKKKGNVFKKHTQVSASKKKAPPLVLQPFWSLLSGTRLQICLDRLLEKAASQVDFYPQNTLKLLMGNFEIAQLKIQGCFIVLHLFSQDIISYSIHVFLAERKRL